MFADTFLLMAQETTSFWAPFEGIGISLIKVVIYAFVGIALAILGFKIFDWLTPGKLDEEILQKQNIAAAILAGAFILGVCIIVAAAVHG